ncbi:CRIB domain-containing protein RIC4-like [Tripterygium wilfordii]|uniref:CRIB domain-containing protein RIC4-like n=1 Tax=Tripterygium wilfordii TaxID=458696 RepID=A0A7J7CRN2_TRIWF|nr:CRIB domain-containing protein RIC4-like [Tripterygium wilfordii]KAF5736619.1 CRIB domain-containing protein RIC4-like [Tripterygium wilfordii]
MKNRLERFVVLRFNIGCNSDSSVAVATSQSKKTKPEPNPPVTGRKEREQSSCRQKMNKSSGFLTLRRPTIFYGIHRLKRSIKSTLSQIFVYREEIEEIETKIEIGFPTDVKHVTHIGLDGTTTSNQVKGWENLVAPELISFPPISLTEFELSMAAHAHAHGPIVLHPTN